MSKYKIASKKTSDLLFPDVRPTLDLNFVENQKVPPFVNVTRNSQTTYVDKFGILRTADIDQPVFEWDPITGKCLGARIWGAVTNLLLRSEEFTSAAWTLFGAATRSADATTSPANTLTADSVTLPAGAGIYQPIAASSNTSYTFSIWIRANSAQSIRVTINTNLGDPVSTSINATTAWQRVSVSKTTSAGTTLLSAQLDTGNGNTFFIWGAQLQTGSILGPYVPTTTTAASSTADVWDILSPTAGINNIRTVYARVRTAASANHGIIALDDTTSSNRLKLLSSGTDAKVTAVAVTSSSTVADLIGGTIVANKTFSVAARFDGNNYAISVNGAPVVTDNDGARAIVGRIMLGRSLQAGEYLNGYIEEIAGWTRACTDAQVAALAAS